MLRIITLMLLLNFTIEVMASDIFLSSHNQVSNRYAVFDDNGKVAFLYLTAVGNQNPVKDAIAYSRIPPVDKVDWEKIGKTGDTPLLEKAIASENAVLTNPQESEFSFRWSADGNAVALLRRGKPIAFASTTEKFGYSKAVAKSSFLANSWDQNKYELIFGF